MSRDKNTHQTGAKYEKLAAEYLERHGYRILERNYRCPLGEIDLIAKDQGTLVFVEVKYRRTDAQGGALAAVDRRKQRQVTRAAVHYLSRCCPAAEEISCRFDVVGIDGEEITLVQDAFLS